jgi:hypothetical protein
MLTFALLLLMIVTRVHHFGDGFHLPDASWAVFFLLGWIGQRARALVVFFVVACALDLWVVNQAAVPADCLSWGYGFLLPAYSVLWLAGRILRGQNLINLLIGLTLAMSCTFVISNLGMWLFAPSAKSLTLLAYSQRVIGYWWSYWQITLLYSLLGILLLNRFFASEYKSVSQVA